MGWMRLFSVFSVPPARWRPTSPGPFSPLAWATSSFFPLLHWVHLGDRFQSRHLIHGQMVFAIGVQLVFIALVPHIRAYFLSIIFIIFGFGVLGLTFRAVLGMWAATCLAVWWVVTQWHVQVNSIANPSALESVAVGVAFALVLLRVVGLGYYATSLRVRMYHRNRELSKRVNAAQEMAVHDDLTGAYNRRAILPLLAEQIHLANRKRQPCCVAMIDIDYFKRVNDQFGHLVGDQVLKRLVALLGREIRSSDKLSRYGGEEFLLLMPATNLAEGVEVATRLRVMVANEDWSGLAEGLQVKISIGLTDAHPGDDAVTALTRADYALYDAKQAGRNRVSVFGGEFAEAPVVLAPPEEAPAVVE